MFPTQLALQDALISEYLCLSMQKDFQKMRGVVYTFISSILPTWKRFKEVGDATALGFQFSLCPIQIAAVQQRFHYRSDMTSRDI